MSIWLRLRLQIARLRLSWCVLRRVCSHWWLRATWQLKVESQRWVMEKPPTGSALEAKLLFSFLKLLKIIPSTWKRFLQVPRFEAFGELPGHRYCGLHDLRSRLLWCQEGQGPHHTETNKPWLLAAWIHKRNHTAHLQILWWICLPIFKPIMFFFFSWIPIQ